MNIFQVVWKRRFVNLGVSLIIFLLATLAVEWRLDLAPDIFTDEILYTRAGIRAAAEGALVWDHGEPLFVHPPLYFLALGTFLKLTSDLSVVVYEPGDIFQWVYFARTLNGLFAGLTGVVLFWLGRRLHGFWLGLFLAGLYLMDPFALRINRRAMIETLAGLLTLAGMAVFLTGLTRKRRNSESPNIARTLISGLFLGAALLTKELSFTAPLALILFGLVEYRQGKEDLSGEKLPVYISAWMASGLAGVIYLIFPFWAASTGRWDRFYSVKILSVKRLVGLVQLSGWNRPDVSILDFLARRLSDYGVSFLLLGLGGLATLFLLLFWRERIESRLLAIWGLVLYTLYGFIAVVGSGNDQFYYYLLLPAIVLVGYTLSIAPQALGAAGYRFGKSRSQIKRLKIIGALAFTLFLLINISGWYGNYAVGTDNSYYKLSRYVQGRIPSGATVNASGDRLKFLYFFPDRPVDNAATSQEALDRDLHYFVLSPKDVQFRYGTMTPELAMWIQTHGNQIFTSSGSSYGEVNLYQIPGVAPSKLSGTDSLPFPRRFDPAQTAFIDGLVVSLLIWFTTLIALAVWFHFRPPRQAAVREMSR
jgi:4-amino-4-deoxy-L-arabinose transferase-like glycosyltransferase